MKLRNHVVVFVFLCVTAALITSRCAVAGGTADAARAMLRQGVEDDESFLEREEAVYPRRRVLYGSQYVDYNTLVENKVGCMGNCGGRGQPNTGRGCLAIYGCR